MFGGGSGEGFAARWRTGSALGLNYFHVDGINLLAKCLQDLAELSLLQPRARGPGRRLGQKKRPVGTDTGQHDAVGQFRRQLSLQVLIQSGKFQRALAGWQGVQAVGNRYGLLAAAAVLPV